MGDQAKTFKEAIAIIPDDQRMALRIVPQQGRVLSLEMIGKQMVAFSALLKACHKEAGAEGKISVNLIRAGFDDEGAFEFEACALLVREKRKVAK